MPLSGFYPEYYLASILMPALPVRSGGLSGLNRLVKELRLISFSLTGNVFFNLFESRRDDINIEKNASLD